MIRNLNSRPRSAERKTAFPECLEQRALLSVNDLFGFPNRLVDGPVSENLTDRFTQDQIIFLDFDGAQNVTYDGPLTIEGINVPAFDSSHLGLEGQEQAISTSIVDTLDNDFAARGVTFTTSQPTAQPYSTIYVGGDDQTFREFGSFQGLAEKNDAGNRDRDDQAFVFADRVASVDSLTSLIAHEAGHLIGMGHEADAGNSPRPFASVASESTLTERIQNDFLQSQTVSELIPSYTAQVGTAAVNLPANSFTQLLDSADKVIDSLTGNVSFELTLAAGVTAGIELPLVGELGELTFAEKAISFERELVGDGDENNDVKVSLSTSWPGLAAANVLVDSIIGLPPAIASDLWTLIDAGLTSSSQTTLEMQSYIQFDPKFLSEKGLQTVENVGLENEIVTVGTEFGFKFDKVTSKTFGESQSASFFDAKLNVSAGAGFSFSLAIEKQITAAEFINGFVKHDRPNAQVSFAQGVADVLIPGTYDGFGKTLYDGVSILASLTPYSAAATTFVDSFFPDTVMGILSQQNDLSLSVKSGIHGGVAVEAEADFDVPVYARVVTVGGDIKARAAIKANSQVEVFKTKVDGWQPGLVSPTQQISGLLEPTTLTGVTVIVNDDGGSDKLLLLGQEIRSKAEESPQTRYADISSQFDGEQTEFLLQIDGLTSPPRTEYDAIIKINNQQLEPGVDYFVTTGGIRFKTAPIASDLFFGAEHQAGWLLDYDMRGDGERAGFDLNESILPGQATPTSGELVLMFDWSDEADESSLGWAEAAGDRLFTLLIEAGILDINDPASAPPIHLIGNGRGSEVVSKAVERLLVSNINVPHVTYLDPNGADARAWKRVDFTDVYNRSNSDDVVGAFNRDVSDQGSDVWNDFYLNSIDGGQSDGWSYSRLANGEATRPATSPTAITTWKPYAIFNGDFEFRGDIGVLSRDDIPGWSHHSFAFLQTAETISDEQNSVLRLNREPFGEDENERTHNAILIPADATDLTFELRGSGSATIEILLGERILFSANTLSEEFETLRATVPSELRNAVASLTIRRSESVGFAEIDNLRFEKVIGSGDVYRLDYAKIFPMADSIELISATADFPPPFLTTDLQIVPVPQRPQTDLRIVGFDAAGDSYNYGTLIDGERLGNLDSLFFAPSPDSNLPGDSNLDEPGFQGNLTLTFSVDRYGETRFEPVEIVVHGGFDGVGARAVSLQPTRSNTLRIQQRLNYLGFPDFESQQLVIDGLGPATVANAPRTDSAIRLFKAAISDPSRLPDEVNSSLGEGDTVARLNWEHAPQWVKLADSINVTDSDEEGEFRYGTSWVVGLLNQLMTTSGFSALGVSVKRISPKSGYSGAQAFNGMSVVLDLSNAVDLDVVRNSLFTAIPNLATVHHLQVHGYNVGDGSILTATFTPAELPQELSFSPSTSEEIKVGLAEVGGAFQSLADSPVYATGKPIGLLGPSEMPDDTAPSQSAEAESSETESGFADEDTADAQFSLTDGAQIPLLIQDHFLPEIASFFSQSPEASPNEFASFLQTLSISDVADGDIAIEEISVTDVKNISNSQSGNLEFELTLTSTVRQSRALFFGSFLDETGDASNFGFSDSFTEDEDGGLTADVVTTSVVPLRFGAKTTQAADSGFFFGLGNSSNSKVSVNLHAENVSIPSSVAGTSQIVLGVLGLDIDGGVLGLNSNRILEASVDYSADLNTSWTLADLQNRDLTELISGENKSSALNATLPVKLSDSAFFDFDLGGNNKLAFTSNDLFGNDPILDLSSFDETIEKLKNVASMDLVGIFDSFGGWIDGVSASEILSQGFDLLDDTSLADSLELSKAWDEVFTVLATEDGDLAFETIQEFVKLLNESGLLQNVEFDGTLIFEVDWEHLGESLATPLDFEADLGEITGFETSAVASLSPEARLRFAITHDLIAVGADVLESTKLSELNRNGVQATVAIQASNAPNSPVLVDDLSFKLRLNDDENLEFEIELFEFDTRNNDTLEDLRADLSRSISQALKSNPVYDGTVQVEVQEGRLVLVSKSSNISEMQVIPAVPQLGFVGTGETSNQADFAIVLSDSTLLNVNLDSFVFGDQTVGQLAAHLGGLSADLAAAVIENHLVLTDKSNGDGDFHVDAVGGSMGGLPGFGVGLVGIEPVKDGDDWVITSADIHDDTIANHLEIRPIDGAPIFAAKLAAAVDQFEAVANFGPLEIEMGTTAGHTCSPEFTAGADVSASLSGAATLASFFEQLPEVSAGGGNTGSLNFGFNSSAYLNLCDITAGSLLGDLPGEPEITVIWSDLTDVDSLTIGLNEDARKLGDFQFVSADLITSALASVFSKLNLEIANHPFLDQTFPGVESKLGSILDFEQTLASVVTELENNAGRSLSFLAQAIENALNEKLNGVASVDVDYDPATSKLGFTLQFEFEKTSKFSPEFDLESLGVGDFGSLADLNGTSMGDVAVGANANLEFGLDLSLPQSPMPYIGDTELILSAGIAAEVEFEASLMVLSAYVGDPAGGNPGTVILTDTGNYDGDPNDAGDWNDTGRAAIRFGLDGDHGLANADFTVIPDVDFHVTLPVYIETTAGIEKIEPDLQIGVSLTETDIIPNVGNGLPFVTAISNEVSSINLANSFFGSSTGWDQIFFLLDKAVDQNLFSSIPLVGEQLQDGVRFVTDLRSKVLDNLSVGGSTVSFHEALFNAIGPPGLNWLQQHAKDSTGGQLRKEDIRIIALPPNVVLSDANFDAYDVTEDLVSDTEDEEMDPGVINQSIDTVIFDFRWSIQRHFWRLISRPTLVLTVLVSTLTVVWTLKPRSNS